MLPTKRVKFARSALTFAATAAVLLLGTVAEASTYNICIQWHIDTVDSCDNAGCGIPAGPNAGGYEDYFQTCNNECNVYARGVRVRLTAGGFDQTFNADTNGCFTFTGNPQTYNMTIYGYSTNSNGAFVRIHNDPSDFTGPTYGQTYSIGYGNVSPTPGPFYQNIYYAPLNVDRKWTAMAALGFSLYRWSDVIDDTEIHAGMNVTQCGASSAHYSNCGAGTSSASCDSNAQITDGRHFLQLGALMDQTCSQPQSMAKFVVSHELGHAVAALHYGWRAGSVNGGEPGTNYSLNTTPNSCGMGGTSYSISSKEYDNVGFREGFAHFVSAGIWNDLDDEGVFRLFGLTHDLERYGFGAGAGNGGHLENECNGSFVNASTNEDWMRFFWDFYTYGDPVACPEYPDHRTMVDFYAEVRLIGGLTALNYFEKSEDAADQLGLLSCLGEAGFDSLADINGINN